MIRNHRCSSSFIKYPFEGKDYLLMRKRNCFQHLIYDPGSPLIMGFNNAADSLIIIMATEQLIKEIKKSNTNKIQEILEGEAAVNWSTYDKKSGRNILQLAIESEDSSVFRLVVGAPGVNLNTPDKNNTETPLQTAILMNSAEFVEVLLDKNANPFLANREGHNAVHKAVLENLPRILETMVRRNVDINSVKCPEGSLLNLAIANCKVEAAVWLLNDKNYRVNIVAKDKQGDNCLLLAVKENLPTLVQMLLDYVEKSEMTSLEKELFVNTQDQNGDSVLHIAYREDFQSIINLLETKGLGINHELKNLKKETIKDIIQKQQQAKQMEAKNQEKVRQIKKLKEKQKLEIKQRQIQKQIEQENQRKEQLKELKRLEKQKLKEKKEQEQKTRWHILVGALVVVILLYFWLDWSIKNRKSSAGIII